MAEEVLTTFKADISELVKQVDVAYARVQKLEQPVDVEVSAQGTEKLNAQLGGLTQKTVLLTEASKKATASEDAQAKAVKNAGNAAQGATKPTDNLAKSTANLGSQGGKLNIFQKAFASIKSAASGVGASFKGFFSKVEEGAGTAGANIGGLATKFTSLLNPVTAVAAGVGAFLLNMTRLDSVKVFLDGIKIGFTGILDQLASGTASIDGFIDSFKEGARIAKELDRLGDVRAQVDIAGAQSDAEVEKLLIKAKDRTRTEEQRVAILKEAQRIETESANKRIALAQDEQKVKLDIFKKTLLEQNRLDDATKEQIQSITKLDEESLKKLDKLTAKGSAGFSRVREVVPLNIDDAARDAAVAASKAAIQIASDSVNITERAQNRINIITEEGEKKREDALKKTQDQREKDAANAEKLARAEEQRILKVAQAQEQLAGIAGDIADKDFARTATDREKELKSIDDFYALQLDKAKAATAALIAASPVSMQADIEKQGNQLLKAINVERGNDRLATNKKFDEAELKATRDKIDALVDATKDQATLQREALNEAYDKRIEDLNTLVEEQKLTVEDANAIQVELAKNLAEDINKIQSDSDKQQADSDKQQADADKKAMEEKQKRLQDSLDLVQGFAEQSLELVATAAAGNEEAQKDAAKNTVLLALDTIEKLILLNAVQTVAGTTAGGASEGGPVGAAAGLIQGIALTVLIKGLFAAVKAQVSQGFFKGTDYVTRGPGEPVGVDTISARLNEGEAVIQTKRNAEQPGLAKAWNEGKVREFIELNFVRPEVNSAMVKSTKDGIRPIFITGPEGSDMSPIQAPTWNTPVFKQYVNMDTVIPRINTYLNSDQGQRIEHSVMVAPFHDANMVLQQKKTTEQLSETNRLLREMGKHSSSRPANKR